ncbi:hypothetical protein HD806DRAFT_542636 [Xylariaceae sp. AK1471]|nr:hypothetical protein HD806DRAFT_542636 [Xylariaceae sp. AK1471]
MVNILVWLVHGDCLDSLCHPHQEAIDVDASSITKFAESLKSAIHRKILTTHKFSCSQFNYCFDASFQVRWIGFPGYNQTQNLAFMSDAELKNQIQMIERRGFRDVLIVKFRDYPVPDMNEKDPRQRGSVEIQFGAENAPDYNFDFLRPVNNPLPEDGGEASQSRAAGPGEGMMMKDDREDANEGDIQSTAMGDEQHGGWDGGPMPAEDVQDCNGKVLENSPSPSGGSDIESRRPSATPAPAPMRSAQPSPATLVIYGPDGEVLVEVPIPGTHQTSSFNATPSLDTVVRSTRPANRKTSTLHSILNSSDTPIEFREQTLVRNIDEIDLSFSTSESDKKLDRPELTQHDVYTTHRSRRIANLRTVETDRTTTPTFVAFQKFKQNLNRQKNIPAEVGPRTQEIFDLDPRVRSITSQNFTPYRVVDTVPGSRSTSVDDSFAKQAPPPVGQTVRDDSGLTGETHAIPKVMAREA